MRRNQLFALLICALLVSGCERAKTKLDREVDRLCAIDGGVKIYETVTLSPENFGPNGEVFPQYQHLTSKGGQLGPEYKGELKSTEIVTGDPNLVRWLERVYRLSDKKIMGEFISYTRGGGDFYGPHQPSAYSCKFSHTKTLVQLVFLKGAVK
jgi:hypothetical protein